MGCQDGFKIEGDGVTEKIDWGKRAQKGYLASGIDPADRGGRKNHYIDLLQKTALAEVIDLKRDDVVLDFGCGSGRFSYWIAPRVGKVIGLEITPEMIDLAEKNRTAQNVEFILYDGIHFPPLPSPVDLILSVGVLQTVRGEVLEKTVLTLAGYLKSGGRCCLIEQATDNPGVDRPSVKEYLRTFERSHLVCLRYYPIRDGRWWLLYLIRYGIIPRTMLPGIARKEILCRRRRHKTISYYQDHLFFVQKR